MGELFAQRHRSCDLLIWVGAGFALVSRLGDGCWHSVYVYVVSGLLGCMDDCRT